MSLDIESSKSSVSAGKSKSKEEEKACKNNLNNEEKVIENFSKIKISVPYF